VKIYTRTGDGGQTGLLDGSRVAKDDARIAAAGEVDELSAWLGFVRARAADAALASLLERVQRELFALGARVADPGDRVAASKAKAALGPEAVARLEDAIDEAEAGLPPLRAFVLPGGSEAGALLHLARASCRRAERALVALAAQRPLDPVLLAYVNRLSDLLFVLARQANHAAGVTEPTW
jgi:cob(I)alamin adenosyltransferase